MEVAAAVLAGAFVQSATGIGFALVAGPVLFALLEPEDAVVLLTGGGLLQATLVLGEHRGHAGWRLLRPVLSAAVPGAVVGLLLLRALPPPVLQAAVGVAVLAGALVRARGGVLRAPAAAVGLGCGALTTSIAVNGPPLALWLASRGVEGHELRATLAAAFLGFGAIAAVVLVPVLDEVDVDPVAPVLAVLAGHALGRVVFRRLDAHRYERLLLVVVAAAGVASLVAAAV